MYATTLTWTQWVFNKLEKWVIFRKTKMGLLKIVQCCQFKKTKTKKII